MWLLLVKQASFLVVLEGPTLLLSCGSALFNALRFLSIQLKGEEKERGLCGPVIMGQSGRSVHPSHPELSHMCTLNCKEGWEM